MDEKSNARSSGLNENSLHKFGYTELFMLLLLFAAGISVDYWLNHHQLPWQSSNIQLQV